MSYEWPLLIFTFLAEVAVGTFICAGCAQLVLSKRDNGVSRTLFLPLMAASAIALCVGLIASLMHLGQIISAPSALLNIGSSWLSREVLFASLSLVGFVVTVMVTRKSFGAAGTIAWGVSTVIGLVFLVSAGNAYLLPTIPLWNTAATPLSMIVSFGAAGTIAWGVSTVIGLVFLVSAGNAYLLPTIPLWNTAATPLSMIVGAFAAGCATVGAFVLIVGARGGFAGSDADDAPVLSLPSFVPVALAGATSVLFGCFYFLLSLMIVGARGGFAGSDADDAPVLSLPSFVPVALAGATSVLFGCFYFLLSLSYGEACLSGSVGAASVAVAAGVQAPIMIGGFICGFLGVVLQLLASVFPAGKIGNSARIAMAALGCALVWLFLFMSRMLFYSCAINLQY